jgi:parvulin-like peptidyl-prolyl isomerase
MKKTIMLIGGAAALAAAIVTVIFMVTGGTDIPQVDKAEVVAVVNDTPISLEEFRIKYKRFTSRFNLPEYRNAAASPELKRSFLNRLIETALLIQEAELRGITVSDDEITSEITDFKEDYPKDSMGLNEERISIQLDQWRENQREKLLIEKLIIREVDNLINVSDAEVRAYYEENSDEFKQPRMVKARQIVVATEEEAKAIRSRLLKGEEFVELAKEVSLSPDADRGGDLGTFARGQMPEEFDDVVFRYRVGSISKVVPSPYGFHIFKVEDKLSPRTLTLDEVREDVARDLFQERREAFFKDWLSSIKERAAITIYPEKLDSL